MPRLTAVFRRLLQDTRNSVLFPVSRYEPWYFEKYCAPAGTQTTTIPCRPPGGAETLNLPVGVLQVVAPITKMPTTALAP